MKRIFLFTTAVLLSFLFSSCKQPQIGILIYDNGLDRWQIDLKYFIESANKKNISVANEVVKKGGIKPNEDLLNKAEILIKKGIKVLVIVPEDRFQASSIVKLAKENNVKVLSYDRLIRNCDLDYYVSFDSEEVGKLQAEYLVNLCPKGNYVIIGGDEKDNNTFLLKKGQMSVLQPYIDQGMINIIYDEFVDEWSVEQGYVHMSRALKKGVIINAVIASCDGLTRGAIKALPKNLLKKVLITGQDADFENCKYLLDTSQVMTVYKPLKELASKAVDISIKLLNNENVNSNKYFNNGFKDVPSFLISPVILDIHNIKKIKNQ